MLRRPQLGGVLYEIYGEHVVGFHLDDIVVNGAGERVVAVELQQLHRVGRRSVRLHDCA